MIGRSLVETDILNISTFEEYEVLEALKHKMTTGPDDVPAFIPKDGATVLLTPFICLLI